MEEETEMRLVQVQIKKNFHLRIDLQLKLLAATMVVMENMLGITKLKFRIIPVSKNM